MDDKARRLEKAEAISSVARRVTAERGEDFLPDLSTPGDLIQGKAEESPRAFPSRATKYGPLPWANSAPCFSELGKWRGSLWDTFQPNDA